MTQPEPTPDDRATKASPRGTAPDSEPGSGSPRWRFEWPRLVAGLVILGMATYLTIAQATAPAGSSSILLSGPMGMVLNLGGIVAGAWVIWSAFRG